MATAHVGNFRIHTVECVNIREPEIWRSTAYIHHGDESEAVEWIHDAGLAATRDEAARLALEAGKVIAADLAPDDSAKNRLARYGLTR
ncbi:hypothetical protein NC00_01435 [Xanthomonas cannabis pv. phaseoli]|uniref:Uncharacterized protein n=1 Tax=Xanthomonas cannabis pv. phaseoli TaxID=1885902 RepID=A0AB34PDY0_9XANT|nr:hypothetical protein [Xanthomonas cannabis]KGK59650.1 hypothetical protein NC00_01435 [Xanthomonas cannabis pv. phaseoli]